MEENGVMGKACILRDFRPREISRISHDKVAAGCSGYVREPPLQCPIAMPSRVGLDVPTSNPEAAEEYI